MSLRVIRDDSPPLSRDELFERGSKLVTDARTAAIDAVRASMHSEFLEKHKTVDVRQLKRWRGRARSAIEAWQKVDDAVSELLREVEKTEAARKAES